MKITKITPSLTACVILLQVLSGTSFSQAAYSSLDSSREAVHDDPFVVYPYRLTSTSPFGRIADTALPGSEVPVDTTLPHFDFTESTRYLKLELSLNAHYQDEKDTNTTNSKQDKSRRVGKDDSRRKENSGQEVSMGDSLLTKFSAFPAGLRIDISGEEGNIAQVDEKMAFTLDENLHIIVEDSGKFEQVDGIEFWVVAIQQLKGQPDRIVSNPLSFVIKIDHDAPQREGAAVYAGIVVLVVCLFALLIPLTVRTKRRLREGKPLCVCGSSSKKMEERKKQMEATGTENAAETGTVLTGNGNTTQTGTRSVAGTGNVYQTGSGTASQTGTGSVVEKGMKKGVKFSSKIGQDNFAMILEGRERSNSEFGKVMTIQSRNLSREDLSSYHFQSRFVDPHYKEVYERPVMRGSVVPSLVADQQVSFDRDQPKPSTSKTEDAQTRM